MNGFNISGIISLKDGFSAAAARVSASAKAMQANLTGARAAAAGMQGTAASEGTILGFSKLAIAGTSAAVGLYKAATAAVEFEKSMAGVRKVMNLSKDDTIALGSELVNLSRNTATSAQGLAEIAAAGGQLGIKRDEIVQFTDGINKLGVAFDMTAEQAGSVFAKIKNSMGLTLDETFSLGDAMNQLSNNTAASASEIARAMPIFGGTAKVLGMSATQAAALATSLIETGRFPEMVGRGLNSILMKLASVADAGKQAVTSMTELGLSSTKVQEVAATRPLEALYAVLEKIRVMPIERRMGAIKNIFGQQWADEIVILANNMDKLRANIEMVDTKDKFDGSALAEYNNKMDTTAAQFDVLMNKLTAIGIQIGSALLPPLNAILSVISAVLDGLGSMGSAIAAPFKAVSSFLGFTGDSSFASLREQLKGATLESQAAAMGDQAARVRSFNSAAPGQSEVNVTGSVTINDQNGKQLGRAPLTKVGKNGAGRVNTGSGIGVGQDYGY